MGDKEIITIEDILEDLRQASKKEDDITGMTASEFAQSLGIGEKKAAKLLKRLVQSGQLKCVRKQIIDVAGRINYSFVYTTK